MMQTLLQNWWMWAVPIAFVAVLIYAFNPKRKKEFDAEARVPLEDFLKSLFIDPPPRVPGTAIFMTATPDAVPHAMLHNLNHNKVLHERVVFVTVEVVEEPWVPQKERTVCQKLRDGIWRVDKVVFSRSVRRLMSGWVHAPSAGLRGAA